MAETATPTSPVEALGGDYIKAASATASAKNAKALDSQVLGLVGKHYKIKSAHYYRVAKDMPWVAISKNVQNQMLEKKVNKGQFAWENPGIVFVEVYPQGTSAFAVAMDGSTAKSVQKFIGYYELSAAK
jgi:hypothetical protein